MQEIGDQPDIHTWFCKSICPQNKIARFLCCNKVCIKPAFMCGQAQCQCMRENHLRCSFVLAEVLVKDISAKKLSGPSELSKALDFIIGIQNGMIESISEHRQRLQQMRQNLGLNSQELRLLNALKKDKGEGIDGVLISKIYEDIQRVQQSLSDHLLEDLRKTIFQQVDDIFRKISSLCLKYKTKIQKMLFKFNKETEASKYFQFDENEKILQRTGQKGIFQVVSKQRISESRSYFFDIELLDTGGNIATGIVTSKICQAKNGFKSEDSIKLFNNGGLWMNGEGFKQSFQSIDRQVVRTVVDRQLNQLRWEVGSKTLTRVPIPQYFLSQPIYFSVEFDQQAQQCKLV